MFAHVVVRGRGAFARLTRENGSRQGRRGPPPRHPNHELLRWTRVRSRCGAAHPAPLRAWRKRGNDVALVPTVAGNAARAGRGEARLGRDSPGVGVRIWNRATGLTKMRQVRLERFGHPRLDLSARRAQREDAVNVGAVRAPGSVFALLVDDEVVLQRRSRSPVARRIAASVPTGIVSESLPATVTVRAPSALCQVSCEPA